MPSTTSIFLEKRGLIGVSGEEATSFLQGLISNDVTKVGDNRAIYSALLTPQGKFLYDFFIFQMDDGLVIDCEADRLDEFKRKLSMYKLRSKVELADLSDQFKVFALIGDDVAGDLGIEKAEGVATAYQSGIAYMDPRLSAAGARIVLPADQSETALRESGFETGTLEDYESLRLKLGLPDGSRDMEIDKAILLENGFKELHGVDWDKGCYMGQELTARTHYRGLVKKRLMPVRIEGPLPEPGTPLKMGDKDVGEMRSGLGGQGLALVRLEAFESVSETGEGLKSGEAVIHPVKPEWADFKTEP